MRKAKAKVAKSEKPPKKAKEKKTKVKKEKKPRRHFTFLPEGKTGDLWLILLTVVLVTFGTVMIFSASYYNHVDSCKNRLSYMGKTLQGYSGFVRRASFADIYTSWG